MFKLSTATVIFAAATNVLAHGGVLSYSWGGQWYWGFRPYNTPVGQVTIQREWDTYDPIQDALATTIACNDNGTALPTGQQLTGTAAAGTAITAYWNNPWPHPYGPMLTYMANCNGNCDNANAQDLEWFKIDESGLISGTVGSGYWGSGAMIANNNSWTSTIPSCIPAGNYLIRFETIALHSQPAQWYPECAQLTVTGGGSTVPTDTCKLPGCYSNTDPGTDIDIYGQAAQTQTTYVVPGPSVFTCGGSNTSKTTTTTTTTKASSTTTTSKTSSTSTTTTKTSSTSKATTTTTTTTTASGATQTHYGQCGGIGWTGATVCASPYTCTYANDYYSQCL